MKIPEFTEDLEIVSKLGDNPGADNGLTAEGLKAKFDEGPLLLKRFLNSVLIAKLNEIFAEGGQLNEGLIMTGPINMNENLLFGLADPKNETEAVSFGYAKRNFAPGGYGLGGTAISSNDLNNETNCGWYAFEKNSANTPFDYGMAMTLNRYGSQWTQIAFNPHMGGDGEICVRSYNGTERLPWEYGNPPMKAGKEYRTIERFNGKSVYAMLVDCGTLPNTSNKSVSTTIPSTANIISATGMAVASDGSCEPFPNIDYKGALECAFFISSAKNIIVNTFKDMSTHTGYITVKYTKE